MFRVVPVILPRDLIGQRNGELELELLDLIDGGRVHHLAARSWRALVAEAAAHGVRLQPTSYGDTYRTLDAQTRGFLRRYTTSYVPGASSKVWNGQRWYLKPGNAPMATPGTSNHGLGLAVDACTVVNGTLVGLDPRGGSTVAARAYQWLVGNYERFGWSHEYTNPLSEPWHVRYVAGDALPAAVLAHERPPIVQPPATELPPPVQLPPTGPPAVSTEDDETVKLAQVLEFGPAGAQLDAAILKLAGNTAVWIPNGLTDAEVRRLHEIPADAAPVPILRHALKGYGLIGPAPSYAPNYTGPRTTAGDFAGTV